MKYENCFFCDNLVSGLDTIGLYHSAYPRVFVKTKDPRNLWFVDYEDWLNASEIDWIDEADEEIKKSVLTMLWDFSVLQEQKEEEYGKED